MKYHTTFVETFIIQNKNSIVIWVIIYTFDTGFSPELTLLEPPLQSTEGILQKKSYRIILQEMVQVLNYHEQVKLITMTPSQCIDYNQSL